MVTESDAGTYSCKAVNNVGERSASAMLTVQSEFLVWSELRYLYQYLLFLVLLVEFPSVISLLSFRAPMFI